MYICCTITVFPFITADNGGDENDGDKSSGAIIIEREREKARANKRKREREELLEAMNWDYNLFLDYIQRYTVPYNIIHNNVFARLYTLIFIEIQTTPRT